MAILAGSMQLPSGFKRQDPDLEDVYFEPAQQVAA
jgi:hypothetical protein